jgi:putative ATP-dependent endonuclease of OLD family
VNHFWRLLSSLSIPHVTLLDLDIARHNGGWGRVRYAAGQLLQHPTERVRESRLDQSRVDGIPAWDDPGQLIRSSELGQQWLSYLEICGVYFSAPLDLDFSMLSAYPSAYHLNTGEVTAPTPDILTAVLGKARNQEQQYAPGESAFFAEYHRMFNNGSKPVQHLSALANLSGEELLKTIPPSLSRLAGAVIARLAELPE